MRERSERVSVTCAKSGCPLQFLDDGDDSVVPADPEVVALGHVMGEDDTGIRADPGQDGQQDVPFERLGLVDDHEGVVQGTAPDVGERQDLQHAAPQHLFDDLAPGDGREGVEDGLRPGLIFSASLPGDSRAPGRPPRTAGGRP